MDQPYKPAVAKKSQALARKKSLAMQSTGDLSKWDKFHLDSHKKFAKRDVAEDEAALKKNQGEYTFQPNLRKARSPSPGKRSTLNQSS